MQASSAAAPLRKVAVLVDVDTAGSWVDNFIAQLREANDDWNRTTGQALHRAHATPCAASAWMRANCRRSCGLCDLELRDALALTSSAARMRASAALKVG